MHKSGLTELEAVLAAARLRTFRLAASELGMSASALSSAVAGLESRLGVRLFHRTTRSVSLTEEGEQFVARVAPAMAEISGAMDVANSRRLKPAGTIRINTSLGAVRMIFAPFVLEFLRRYPEVTVSIVTEAKNVDIVAAGFDAGLRLSELVPKDMVRVPIGSDMRMAVVATPTYFAQRPIPHSPADLCNHQGIRLRLPDGAPYRWEFMRRDESVTLDVLGRLVVDSPMLMIDAVRAGVGLAYLAEWYVSDEIRAGRLIRVLEEWTPPFPGLALYYPAGRHVPGVLRAFVDLIRELDVQ